ncbi:hypothetical protein EJB05_21085 [Eragrostis curvula]|uniref:HMA domain-containing protein n=1 Tax=Eragrostis curvula TaxID=38414 RepID=A0A5J9V0T2_9POAL|nr:hypothetical protein EJB05_21085 [Eragrostis curvula]
MKQKIVIKVQMTCDKCRSKAMSLVAATGGVDSVELAGDAKDQVVVVGEGVDSIKLTSALRKKVGPAQLVQVGEAKKKEEKKPDAVVAEYPWHYYYPPHGQPVSVVYEQRPDNTCSIM